MNPRISVVMPVYNGLPYLREAIESVFCQTFKDFELLIFIDGPEGDKDGSLAVAQSYAMYDSRVRVILNEINLGTALTMNKGIELARAPIVARLDQDDVSLPRRLEAQLQYLEAHPELSIVSTWEYGIDAKSRRVRNWRGSVENYGAFLGPLALAICPIWHPSIMFRRDAMIALGGYKKGYQPVEDFECTMRLALGGYRCGIVPEYLVGQRHHGARQSVTKLAAQVKMRKKVHNEMLSTFLSNTIEELEQLGQFLRMDSAAWTRMSKEEFYRMYDLLHRLFEGMRTKLDLTDQEFETMVKIVRMRLGSGVRYAEKLKSVPAAIFFPTIFILSPFLFPRIRRMAQIVYEFMHELRYPRRLLRAGLERRDQ